MREHVTVRRMPYGDAKGEVEEKLRKQQLTKPLTEKEMTAFCDAMARNLELTPSALTEVRRWVRNWQARLLG